MRSGLVLLCGVLLGCATPKSPTPPKDASRAPATASVRSRLRVDGTDLSLHLPSRRAPPLPAVLVFHSALGRTEAVLDYADTLAERGYAACVLDFYRGELPRSLDEARALRDEANENADAHQRLVADAYAMLAVDPRVQATHRFLLGWSYGGAWATFSAGTLEDVSGVVAIYGEAFADATLYERVSTPVALVGAARDTEPSIERLRDVEAELHRRGTEVSLVIVDAAHGFMEPAHPGYSQQAAEQAWESVLVFLDGTSDRR